ncbi:hypothetical protein PoB_001717400 [Plakobranchus ocellatus]|uniref:Uncharacterized protein n=1 Tax=Plakobranchus ocellatus TaxID=259542 RepID=A0AAV3Z9P2_9GAST|nr:hypothetical protein PoB_001717400 [Plakobranchus ocellatus]
MEQFHTGGAVSSIGQCPWTGVAPKGGGELAGWLAGYLAGQNAISIPTAAVCWDQLLQLLLVVVILADSEKVKLKKGVSQQRNNLTLLNARVGDNLRKLEELGAEEQI